MPYIPRRSSIVPDPSAVLHPPPVSPMYLVSSASVCSLEQVCLKATGPPTSPAPCNGQYRTVSKGGECTHTASALGPEMHSHLHPAQLSTDGPNQASGTCGHHQWATTFPKTLACCNDPTLETVESTLLFLPKIFFFSLYLHFQIIVSPFTSSTTKELRPCTPRTTMPHVQRASSGSGRRFVFPNECWASATTQ